MKRIITVNIGNKGTILSVIGVNRVIDTFFLETFNQDSLPTVLEFFKKYKNLNAVIMLDTVAQNYNYKIFPPLNYFDLQNMVNRKFNTEIPKNDLKQKRFLYKNGLDKRSVYLFISASIDSPLKEWLNFFNVVSNNLVGIYMVPLEAEDLAKKILSSNGMKYSLKKKNNWILIVFNNRTSDLRQVAIFNNSIAFTRLLSLDSVKENLAEFARNDIIRTSEYIKRFDTNFSFDKLTIITILDPENKAALRELKMEKALFFNYTPFEISKLLKLGGNYVKKDEKFFDVLMSLFSMNNSRKIRFGNQKINITNTLIKTFTAIKSAIVILILSTIASFAYNILTSGNDNRIIENLNLELNKNKEILQSKTNNNLNVKTGDIDQIIDAGLLKDVLDAKYMNPVDTFQRFVEAQKGNALTYNLRWHIENFDYQDAKGIKSAKTLYDISIINPEGTASKLFSRYDALNLKLKETFKEQMTGITNLPNNINFSQRYLTYPIKVEIMDKGPGYVESSKRIYDYNLEDEGLYE